MNAHVLSWTGGIDTDVLSSLRCDINANICRSRRDRYYKCTFLSWTGDMNAHILSQSTVVIDAHFRLGQVA